VCHVQDLDNAARRRISLWLSRNLPGFEFPDFDSALLHAQALPDVQEVTDIEIPEEARKLHKCETLHSMLCPHPLHVE